MKTLILASAAMMMAAPLAPAQAQIAYDDSVLNGCYARTSSSVDAGVTESEAALGTTCFDGKGHILVSNTSPRLSGGYTDLDGTVIRHGGVAGTYRVTNSPGDGMGFLEGPCSKHAFVLHNVQNGLARGYSFILLERKKGCKPGAAVVRGSAEYQGPLK